MFFGHIGAALAARPAAPKASLGVLLVAAMGLDTLSGMFTLLGIERTTPDGTLSIPWSHGLFMAVVWSIVAFAIAFLASRRMRSSLVVAGVVFSHWVLDFISHPMGMGKPLPPDLPLFFDRSAKVGLGLYNSPVAAFVTEFALLAGGTVLYLLRTRANDRTGKWAFWTVPLFLFSTVALVFLPGGLDLIVTFAVLLLLPIGMWIDRHRALLPPQASTASGVSRAGP